MTCIVLSYHHAQLPSLICISFPRFFQKLHCTRIMTKLSLRQKEKCLNYIAPLRAIQTLLELIYSFTKWGKASLSYFSGFPYPLQTETSSEFRENSLSLCLLLFECIHSPWLAQNTNSSLACFISSSSALDCVDNFLIEKGTTLGENMSGNQTDVSCYALKHTPHIYMKP